MSLDFFLATAEQEGAALFPSGLLMYDLPTSRRTAARLANDRSISSQKPSPSPIPSSSSSASSIVDDDRSVDDDSNKKTLTTSEDWWRQAIEPITTKTIPTSTSTFSMIDDDRSNSDPSPFQSLFPSSNRITVHNQRLTTLSEIYSNKATDHVKQWYEHQTIPSLSLLIKRGLLKIHKEKSIRMVLGSKKKELLGELDQHGRILCSFDDRSFDSIEQFYRAYQSRRRQDDSLAEIYRCVRWYDQTFHSILLEYAENMVKVSGLQTRLINDDELFPVESLSKEILCQINCWTDGRNDIDI